MNKKISKKKLLSQNFLKDKALVSSLVEKSSINKKDTVLEIGPGNGIITTELLRKAGYVIAVEKDPDLFEKLLLKYKNRKDIEVHNSDILQFDLPKYEYKVFSNIPFSIEGTLVRKLIYHPHNPPVDAYLIMRRDVATRMVGIPKEGLFSLLHKPWFDLEIFHDFKREDFKPEPKVQSSMLRFTKKKKPIIDFEMKENYRLFLEKAFGGGGRIKQNLSPLFSKTQLYRLSSDLGFGLNSIPTQLSFEQWLGLYNFFIKSVDSKTPTITKKK